METGFTHQIRAQAAANGHPLVGDGTYGARDRRHHYLLHARTIRLGYFDSILGFRSLDAPLPHRIAAPVVAAQAARQLDLEIGHEGGPLVFFRGGFGRYSA